MNNTSELTAPKTKRAYNKKNKNIEQSINNDIQVVDSSSNPTVPKKKRVYNKKNKIVEESIHNDSPIVDASSNSIIYSNNNIPLQNSDEQLSDNSGNLIIDNFIYLEDNNLPDVTCNDIIDMFIKSDKKTPGTTASGVLSEVKNTNDLYISDLVEFKEIDKILYNKLHVAIKNYLGKIKNYLNSVKISEKITYFETVTDFGYQIQEYIKNEGKYIWHSDSLDLDGIKKNNQYRMLAFIWYLNDVDEGGETEFIHGKVTPKRGSLLIFPCSWTYMHKGNIPVSNNKYIITGWVGYRL
uniref:Fe2OG dioxygenase domain-containing protein n=1 Tax=viral metagenome TaxID=1070528 RepID=A0A6C0LAG7_9ZZZZ